MIAPIIRPNINILKSLNNKVCNKKSCVKRSAKTILSIVPSSNSRDSIFCFGKHDGERFSDVPRSYLMWIVSHAMVLKVENRSVVEKIKLFLAEQEAKASDDTVA